MEIPKYPTFYKIFLFLRVTSGGSCTPIFQRIAPPPSVFWCYTELLIFLASVLERHVKTAWIVSLLKSHVHNHKFCYEGYVGQTQTYLTLIWYHGVYVTPVLFDSLFFNCHEYGITFYVFFRKAFLTMSHTFARFCVFPFIFYLCLFPLGDKRTP